VNNERTEGKKFKDKDKIHISLTENLPQKKIKYKKFEVSQALIDESR
jgi:hypothetical protein